LTADKIQAPTEDIHTTLLVRTVRLYPSDAVGIESLVGLIEDLKANNQTPIELLHQMYLKYPPFNYSVMNKEASLIIRSKKVVDSYCQDATPEERQLLDTTESEAQLTRKWVLAITKQPNLELKMLYRNFNSPDLILLHKIQARWLNDYRRRFADKVRILR